MELSLLKIYKIPKKIATKTFSTPSVSDSFNPYFILFYRAGNTGGGASYSFSPPSTFLRSKKERVSKQNLLKGCPQGQNVIVLTILERLEFETFSCRPTIVADNTFQCSMAPLL